jgi:hypothetical protein
VPVYAIVLAIALFLIGSVMITLGALMLTGRIATQVCICLFLILDYDCLLLIV